MRTFFTLLISLSFSLFSVTANAQAANDTIWTRHIGGSGLDRPSSVSIAADGSIYVGAVTYSTDLVKHPSLGNGDGLVVKLNSNGDTLWTRYSGGSDPEDIYGVAAMPDSGVVVVGVSYSDNLAGHHGMEDGLIIRYDKNGNVLWQKLIGGSAYPDGMEQFFDVKATSDGGFIAAGVTGNFWIFGTNLADTTTGAADGWLVKFDGNGNKQWFTRVFSPFPPFPIDQIYNELISVQVLSHNQGYLALGNTGHFATLDSTDFFLTKFDINGKLIWKKRYGSSRQDQAFQVIELPNGNYMMGGFVTGGGKNVTGIFMGKRDMWYAVTDTAGTILSEQIYGDDEVDEIHDMVTNGNSDVVITGRFDFETTVTLHADGAIMNVSTAGSSFSPQIIRFDGNQHDVAYAIAHDTVTDDFIVAFSSNSSDGFFPVNKGGEDIWVFRLKQPVGLSVGRLSNSGRINIYPNPVQSKIVIHSPQNEKATINIFSITGQKVYNRNAVTGGNCTVDVSALTDGIYILEYQNEKETYREKFVKE